jgi:hypothetical protein
MADLSITAANVTAAAGAVSAQQYTSGATITAGMAVYIDTAASNVAKIAHCETSAATAVVKGIALNGASSGQPVNVAVSGALTIGATVAVGTIYVLSTAGLICPAADLVSDDWVSVIGVATTAAIITINIQNSGVQVP